MIAIAFLFASQTALAQTPKPSLKLQDLKPVHSTPDPHDFTRVQAPKGAAGMGDRLVVCRVPQTSGGQVTSHETFVVNDAMGYQMCSERGGTLASGDSSERVYMDINDSAKPRDQRRGK